MTTFYPGELRKIADAIEFYQSLTETVAALNDGTVEVDYDEAFEFVLHDENGDLMGYIGWTEDGSIGFTVGPKE